MIVRLSPAARGMLGSVLFVAIVLSILLLFNIDEKVLQLLNWLEAQGHWASLLFILLMIIVVVLLLPGVLFTTGAGFVFGIMAGTLYVVIGTTLGAIFAFLIARHLFGEHASNFVRQHTKLKLVNEELTPQGWKIVLLSRLIPFFPFKLSNYFFGLTSFSLRGFAGGTFLGIIPFSLHNVYLGSLAADITLIGTRNSTRTPLEWALYGIGFVVAIIIILYLNRLASRALERYTDIN